MVTFFVSSKTPISIFLVGISGHLKGQTVFQLNKWHHNNAKKLLPYSATAETSRANVKGYDGKGVFFPEELRKVIIFIPWSFGPRTHAKKRSRAQKVKAGWKGGKETAAFPQGPVPAFAAPPLEAPQRLFKLKAARSRFTGALQPGLPGSKGPGTLDKSYRTWGPLSTLCVCMCVSVPELAEWIPWKINTVWHHFYVESKKITAINEYNKKEGDSET